MSEKLCLDTIKSIAQECNINNSLDSSQKQLCEELQTFFKSQVIQVSIDDMTDMELRETLFQLGLTPEESDTVDNMKGIILTYYLENNITKSELTDILKTTRYKIALITEIIDSFKSPEEATEMILRISKK